MALSKVDGTNFVGPTIPASAGGSGRTVVTGNILQVVQQVYTTFTQSNSTSYTDTGITLDITPSSTSNKILITCSAQVNTNTALAQAISFDLLRDGSSIKEFEAVLQGTANFSSQISFTYLDSPSSTSALTYKIQYKGNSSNYYRINNEYTSGNCGSTLTLMEVAG